jgi:hypothetical protein
MEGNFPFELVCLRLSGERVCGSQCQALEWDWGYRTARMLYADNSIIWGEDFHLIWWDGLGAAMARYPKMYKVWLTKHVSDCGGTNSQLYYWSGGEHSRKCKFCGTADEYSSHICHCQDSGWDRMLCILVKELVFWLKETLAKCFIVKTIEMYLLSCSKVPMLDCVHGSSHNIVMAAAASNCLGYGNFLEGRISTHWLAVTIPLLRGFRKFILPPSWGRQFINKLHIIVHKQWIFRNSFIHYRSADGLTLPEHHNMCVCF